VGNEYDAWTNEGILEAYWGEHIHLGYYNDQVADAEGPEIASCALQLITLCTLPAICIVLSFCLSRTQERAAGYKKKDFKAAKFDFVDEMLAWGMGSATSPARILDVGCGFGGTSRHLAKRFTSADIQGEQHAVQATPLPVWWPHQCTSTHTSNCKASF
jgi:MPBQ/MSBQ methyltransferase